MPLEAFLQEFTHYATNLRAKAQCKESILDAGLEGLLHPPIR
jgi:hypothetical protein